jgi:hypothetical protein
MTSRREVLKVGLAVSALLPLGARAGSVAVDAARARDRHSLQGALRHALCGQRRVCAACGALFCLERLAWEQRMRYRSELAAAQSTQRIDAERRETLFSWVIAPAA